MVETLGFEVFAKDGATAGVTKAARAFRKAGLDVEAAQIKVAKSSRLAAEAEQRFGKESLQARDAASKLARAQYDLDTAGHRLATTQRVISTETDTSTSRQQRAAEITSNLKDGFYKATAAVAGFGTAAAVAYKIVQDSLRLGLIEANAQVALGAEGFKELSATARTSAHSMGLTTSEFLAGAGQAAILAKNLGFTQETAVSFGAQLPDLASRLSLMSSGERTAAEMSDILRSALAGEFDPLQAVGIAITASTVAQVAANIQTKNAGKLSQQQATSLAVLEIVQTQVNRQTGVMTTEQGKSAIKVAETNARLREQWQTLESKAGPAMLNFADRWVKAQTLITGALIVRPSDLGNLKTVIYDNNAAISVASAATNVYKAAIAATTKSVADATWTEQAYTDALNANKNATLALRGSETAYWASVTAVDEAVKQNGRTLDVHTAKGRANRDALDQEATAALGYLDAMKAQGKPAAEFNKALDDSWQRLHDGYFALTGNEKAARNYANSILRIPHQAATGFITPGMSAAQANVAYFIGLLGRIPRTVTVTTRYIADRRSVYSSQVPRAAGGWIPGAPSMRDSVPAMLAQGEFVVNSQSARRYGSVLESINNNRYASGGMVGFGPRGWADSIRITIENHGVIGSESETENWLVQSITNLKRKGRM